MQILLIVLVLMAVYFWAKYTFFKVDLSRNVEVFPSRGAPLVKRAKLQATEKKPESQYKASQEESVQKKNNIPTRSELLPKAVLPENAQSIELKLPEDVVLRRHFMTQLKAKIEVKLGAKPTDFCLARHYEAMVQTEIAKALARGEQP